MKKIIVLIPLLLAGCNASTSDDVIEWKVTVGKGLECTNPDATDYHICYWYCRDYRGHKNVDVIIRDTSIGEGVFLDLVPSKKCDVTDFDIKPIDYGDLLD